MKATTLPLTALISWSIATNIWSNTRTQCPMSSCKNCFIRSVHRGSSCHRWNERVFYYWRDQKRINGDCKPEQTWSTRACQHFCQIKNSSNKIRDFFLLDSGMSYNWIDPGFPPHGSTPPKWDTGRTYMNPYIVEKLWIRRLRPDRAPYLKMRWWGYLHNTTSCLLYTSPSPRD